MAPVLASTTTIEVSVMEVASSDGENEARTPVLSATFGVVVDSESASWEELAPLTVTAVSEGGCRTRLRSILLIDSAATEAVCVYDAPSPVAMWRGTRVNGPAGAAGTGGVLMAGGRGGGGAPGAFAGA